MPCRFIEIPELGAMAICRGQKTKSCGECRRPSEFQCDFPVGVYKSGKKKGQSRTCDRHLCKKHARHGVTPGIDFCSEHFPVAKAAYQRRNHVRQMQIV